MPDNHRPAQDQYVWKVRYARPYRKDSVTRHFSDRSKAYELMTNKKVEGTLLFYGRYQIKDVMFDAEGQS